MMSELSPESSFFAISGFYPESLSEALPARTSAPPTPKAKVSKASGRASTSKPSASSEKSALVGSLLRTALISELGALTSSSLQWRPSATPAGRLWSVLAISAPTMSDRAPGSSDAISNKLPTPVKPNGGRSLSVEAIETGKRPNGQKSQIDTPNMLRHAMKMNLATPRKSDADRGFRGDVLAQLQGQNNRHAGMLGTPTANAAPRGSVLRRMKGAMHSDQDDFDRTPTISEAIYFHETLPTPTKRDKRMDAWSPAYDKRKSPTMDAVLDGAMTDRSPDKWAYARQIASLLSSTGLTGPSMTLPITYGWMMGYPPGWLARALQSAVRAGHLRLPSSSKRSATP